MMRLVNTLNINSNNARLMPYLSGFLLQVKPHFVARFSSLSVILNGELSFKCLVHWHYGAVTLLLAPRPLFVTLQIDFTV